MSLKFDKGFWNVFWFLLLLNVFSSVPYLSFIKHFAVLNIIQSLGLAGMFAFIEAWIVYVIGTKSRRGARVILGFITVFILIFIAADVFSIYKFHTQIDYSSFVIILNTNPEEVGSFFKGYFSWTLILILLLTSVGVLLISYCVSHLLQRNIPVLYSKIIAFTLSITGLIVLLSIPFIYLTKGTYNSTYENSIYTRTLFCAYKYFIDKKRVKAFIASTEKSTASGTPKFDVIFILGESYNRNHSPLYGYDKMTTPHLTALQADSSLIVFNNVTAPADFTESAVKGIFSLAENPGNYYDEPFFPALFKKSGYITYLYENQYAEGKTESFLSDRTLSNISFDHRVDFPMTLDHFLLDSIQPNDKFGLYVIHLYGQHFQYRDRYPQEWSVFKPSDYPDTLFTANQRNILANYDNSILYNDYVVSQIFQKWRHRKAVMIYISDHGDEVFDCRDFFGHGNSEFSPFPEIQLKIPMFVAFTKDFALTLPEKVNSLKQASTLPVTANDIGHLILNLCDITSPDIDSTRSAISEHYNPSNRRYVHYYSGDIELFNE